MQEGVVAWGAGVVVSAVAAMIDAFEREGRFYSCDIYFVLLTVLNVYFDQVRRIRN